MSIYIYSFLLLIVFSYSLIELLFILNMGTIMATIMIAGFTSSQIGSQATFSDRHQLCAEDPAQLHTNSFNGRN
jgi:hypothetical protein